MSRDFWHESKVAVIGGGSWGTVLSNLIAPNCSEVYLWMRDEVCARQTNATRANPKYVPSLRLRANIKAYSELDRVFENSPHAVFWVLPSKACREQAKLLAKHIRGDEIVLHATKGIEEGSLKRISTVLSEELPCRRIGVISGPNLADEIARGEPAATVVASRFDEVIYAGERLLAGPTFRVFPDKDIVGVEWAGALKNILAIAAGSLDALKLGWNARAMLITRGLAEMVRLGLALGAQEPTFLGLAGVGDVLATCSSSLSRNYQVGFRLAQGQTLEAVLQSIGRTAEGAKTALNVWEFAQKREIYMPITQAVCQVLRGEIDVMKAFKFLMDLRPGSA